MKAMRMMMMMMMMVMVTMMMNVCDDDCYLVMKVILVKEVMSCDVSPVAMFIIMVSKTQKRENEGCLSVSASKQFCSTS